MQRLPPPTLPRAKRRQRDFTSFELTLGTLEHAGARVSEAFGRGAFLAGTPHLEIDRDTGMAIVPP